MGSEVTRILFIDNDETFFEIRKCIALAIEKLPPVELFHANDATEGLMLLENLAPDVVILDEELNEELDLFLDSLGGNHPPIVLQTENGEKGSSIFNELITCIKRNDSLEGIHQTLLVATSLAVQNLQQPQTTRVH